jgi:hypothetical protein
MVVEATNVARVRGAKWLHVDFEPHLTSFYRRCGFRPTVAHKAEVKTSVEQDPSNDSRRTAESGALRKWRARTTAFTNLKVHPQ